MARTDSAAQGVRDETPPEDSLSVLGVIPARGGSKGIPNKNLAPLAGEPLVVHTIRAALAATRLTQVVCSTDSAAIAEVARAAGVEVVMRPAELATDTSLTEDVLQHAIDALGEPEPDYVVTLAPTSPLRSARLIDECVERAVTAGADALITVAASTAPWGHLEDGTFRPLDPKAPRRRQGRTPLYRESSTVYVTRVAHLRATHSVLGEPLYAVVVPDDEALDVDTPLDLAVAEALLAARRHRP